MAKESTDKTLRVLAVSAGSPGGKVTSVLKRAARAVTGSKDDVDAAVSAPTAAKKTTTKKTTPKKSTANKTVAKKVAAKKSAGTKPVGAKSTAKIGHNTARPSVGKIASTAPNVAQEAKPTATRSTVKKSPDPKTAASTSRRGANLP